MNLLRTNRIASGKAATYATTEDFAALFTDEMNSLYLLAFLLTGDHEKAEQCFVASLESCVKGNPVFKQWAFSWAKRMIVETAIRIIAPRPHPAGETAPAIHLELNGEPETARDRGALVAGVLELADFERFVFVMSVLERYPDQDCSVQLGYPLRKIRDARIEAQQQITQSYVRNGVENRAALFHRGDHSAETVVGEFRMSPNLAANVRRWEVRK